jgi:hypothetical protein
MEDGKWKRIHRQDAKAEEERKKFEQKETEGAKRKRFSDRMNRIKRIRGRRIFHATTQ